MEDGLRSLVHRSKLQDLKFGGHKSVQSEENRNKCMESRARWTHEYSRNMETRNWWTNKYENYRTH